MRTADLPPVKHLRTKPYLNINNNRDELDPETLLRIKNTYYASGRMPSSLSRNQIEWLLNHVQENTQ